MKFKNISAFIDIYYLDKPFQDILLNYEEISQSKVIAHIKKIDISILDYDIDLSKLIFFTLKFIQDRKKDDFNEAFDSLLIILDRIDEDSFEHSLSYVWDILLLGAKTYDIDISSEVEKYKEKLDNIQDALAYMWLSTPLAKYGYCDENIVSNVLSRVKLNLQLSYLEDLKKFACDSLYVDNLFLSLAQNMKKLVITQMD